MNSRAFLFEYFESHLLNHQGLRGHSFQTSFRGQSLKSESLGFKSHSCQYWLCDLEEEVNPRSIISHLCDLGKVI